MRRFGLIGAIVAASLIGIASAQRAAPDSASVTINGKTMAVKYSAVSAKGRKIFGGVVPFNRVWQIGDGSQVTFHTDTDLVFKGFVVPKGDYTLYVLPVDAKNWQLIVNKQTGPTALTYDAKLDVGRTAMTVTAAPAPVETLRLAVVKTAATAAKIEIAWENIVASARFNPDRSGSNTEW
jgi:archaellum component FlaF (FlaF/FlaG flagellin family)